MGVGHWAVGYPARERPLSGGAECVGTKGEAAQDMQGGQGAGTGVEGAWRGERCASNARKRS